MNHTLSDFEKDQVNEIVNIGAGNAATALSHMMGKKVQIDVPFSTIGTTDEVLHLLGKSDDTVLTIYLKMSGDIGGGLAIIFSPQVAITFVGVLTGEDRKDASEFTEVDISALREVGNILLGASLTALSKFLNLHITHSIPDVSLDMLGAIMDSVLIDVGKDQQKILAVRINLTVSDDSIGGEMYYLFDPESTAKILEMTKAVLSKTSR